MEVEVCIAGACHLRGSYGIMRRFRELAAAHGVAERVTVSPAFCLGHCADGVTVRIGAEVVTGVTAANAQRVFEEKILGLTE